MQTIAFAMQKGGVTKTVTAAHAAVYLARRGYRVLAVDLDKQANLTSYLMTAEAFEELDVDLVEVFLEGRPIAEVLTPTLHERLDVAPSGPDMARLSAGLTTVPRREEVLRRALRTVADRFDYVVIDCAPAADLVVQNALCAADWLVMPLECSNFCLDGLTDFWQWVESFRDYEVHNAQWLGVVLSKIEPNTRIYKAMKEEIANSPFDLLAEVPKRVGVEILISSRHVASEILMPEIAVPYQGMVDEILTRTGAGAVA